MPYLAGNALIVVYGPAEVKFTLAQLRLQWTTTSMIVFIIILGLLLGGLHWGKAYVAGLRAEAQAASVRTRWRSKAKKEPQLLIFSHALLFSAYAGLIGERTTSSLLPFVGWSTNLLWCMMMNLTRSQAFVCSVLGVGPSVDNHFGVFDTLHIRVFVLQMPLKLWTLSCHTYGTHRCRCLQFLASSSDVCQRRSKAKRAHCH